MISHERRPVVKEVRDVRNLFSLRYTNARHTFKHRYFKLFRKLPRFRVHRMPTFELIGRERSLQRDNKSVKSEKQTDL